MNLDMVPSPFGMRGERPLSLTLDPESPEFRLLNTIPGVAADPRSGLTAFPWDLWPTVAGVVDPSWRPPAPTKEQVRALRVGQEKFERYFNTLPDRTLREKQRSLVLNISARDYALLQLPMRSGKSPIVMAMLTLRGCRRNMIIPPADLRYNWINEIRRWLPDDKILELRGRGGNEGRFVGERFWIKDEHELVEAMKFANWTVCHYDVYKPQGVKDGAGKTFWDPKLPGFFPTLKRVSFDAFVADESHNIKTPWVTGDRGTRGDIIAELFRDRTRAKLAYALTATPTAGLVKHYWQQLRLIAGAPVRPNRINLKHPNPWLRADKVPGWDAKIGDYGFIWGGIAKPFTERYCAAGHVDTDNPYVPSGQVWFEDGESNILELKSRLKKIVWARTPKEMSGGMPEVYRQLELIDPKDRAWRVPKTVLTQEGSKARLRQLATKFKAQYAAPRIARAILAGKKVQVLVDERVEPSQIAYKYLVKALQKELGKKAKLPQVWLVNSEDCPSVKQRDAYAKAFREYSLGGCAYITTSGKARGGFSLRGAQEVHVIGISPFINDHMQAEKRAAEHGEDDLHVIYYAIADSYDEVDMENRRRKFALIAKLEENGDAESISQQLKKMEKEDEISFEALANGASVLEALGLSEGLEGDF